MHEHEKQIPIWFFIGAVLAAYGVLILGTGIYELLRPPPESQRVALWNLHADIWWSALVLAFGLFYVIRYWPTKKGESLTGKE